MTGTNPEETPGRVLRVDEAQDAQQHLAWAREAIAPVNGTPREGSEREHGRLPPHDVRGRDGRHRHRRDLAVGAGLIGVDLQEHVPDAQGRALTMGDDNLDLLHATHHRSRRPMSPVYPRATAL